MKPAEDSEVRTSESPVAITLPAAMQPGGRVVVRNNSSGPIDVIGPMGTVYPFGPTGPVGRTGSQGPVGPTGHVGPHGATGPSVIFRRCPECEIIYSGLHPHGECKHGLVERVMES